MKRIIRFGSASMIKTAFLSMVSERFTAGLACWIVGNHDTIKLNRTVKVR